MQQTTPRTLENSSLILNYQKRQRESPTMKSARSSRHRCGLRGQQHLSASLVFHNHVVLDLVLGLVVLILLGSSHTGGPFNRSGTLYVAAWKHCSPDEGGGICPTQNTCCPTGVAGISSCIPHRKHDAGPGECCDSDGHTGCGYGYYCSSTRSSTTTGASNTPHDEHAVCQLIAPDHPPPGLNALRTPRYRLCDVASFSPHQHPNTTTTTREADDVFAVHGFPIPSFTEPTVSYNATYYSNRGNIRRATTTNTTTPTELDTIETVLIIVHGSGRNAEDYLCAGLSLLNNHNHNNHNNSHDINNTSNHNHTHTHQNTLVLAPKFLVDMDLNTFIKEADKPLYWDDSDTDLGSKNDSGDDDYDYDYEDENENIDDTKTSSSSTSSSSSSSKDTSDIGVDNPLYWAEIGPVPHSDHTWRYGAEALNTIRHSDTSTTSTADGGEGTTTTTGISSYDVTDKLLEYIVQAKKRNTNDDDDDNDDDAVEYVFPKVRRIVVMGHSAGGQYVQRWSLLTNSPIMNSDDDDSNKRNVDIRTVVANPRSYCYLDNRRMVQQQHKRSSYHAHRRRLRVGNDQEEEEDNDDNNDRDSHRYTATNNNFDEDDEEYVFAVPDRSDRDACPSYNEWEWGLEDGNIRTSPYRDRALNTTSGGSSSKDIAIRFGTKRKVYYLVGSNDTIDLDHDGCEQYNRNFQGYTRNQRGHHYYTALQEFYKNSNDNTKIATTRNPLASSFIHRFDEVQFSPHDHTIMFQSKQGRAAIFGEEEDQTLSITTSKTKNKKEQQPKKRDGNKEVDVKMAPSSSSLVFLSSWWLSSSIVMIILSILIGIVAIVLAPRTVLMHSGRGSSSDETNRRRYHCCVPRNDDARHYNPIFSIADMFDEDNDLDPCSRE